MRAVDPLVAAAAMWVVWAAYWVLASRRVNETKVSEGRIARLQHLGPLVIGFVLLFDDGRLFHLRAQPGAPFRWVAAVVTLVGLLFAVWGRLHLGRYWSGIITLKEGHRLIRTGPYALVRHPLYTGFLLAVIGTAAAASTADALVAAVAILVAYLAKIRREEAVLAGEFGAEYESFRREVPALVPFRVPRRRG